MLMKTVSATTLSDNALCFQILKKCMCDSSVDDELRNIRHQKARDHYANMPLYKKAELNARKRKN